MKKLWDFRKVLSYLELEGQGPGIIMRVTHPLLLGPFYYVFSYVTPNISAASVAIVSHCTIHETRHIAVIPKINIFAVWGWKHCRISWKCSFRKNLTQSKLYGNQGRGKKLIEEKNLWPCLFWHEGAYLHTYLTLVYYRNHYFGLVWYRNWYVPKPHFKGEI